MTYADVGRNDLCPCGSGLEYKKCCLGREDSPQPSGPHAEFLAGVRRAMEGKEFGSREEAQAFLDDLTRQRNRAPRDDFHGLSSEQMTRLLYFPFDSPELVTFPACLDAPPSAPILTLLQLLINAIGDKGLRPTATGNLPLRFLREAGLAYWGEDGYREHTQFGDIRSEPDFSDMHVTRIVAQLAHMVRKYKGKFILSRECRMLLNRDGMTGVHPRILRPYAGEFNWGYRDHYPDMVFIQSSFLFTLYLLSRYGGEWRPSSFYEDQFLRAFPIVLREVPPEWFDTPEKTVRNCYSWRCLRWFAGFLGLAEIEMESNDIFERQFRLRKLPLLDEAVIFRF